MLEQNRRSLAKAVTWRAIGTVHTFALSWIVTGEVHLAGAIAGIEVVTKVALFFVHERAWNQVAWGRKTVKTEDTSLYKLGREFEAESSETPPARAFGLTWRSIGSVLSCRGGSKRGSVGVSTWTP